MGIPASLAQTSPVRLSVTVLSALLAILLSVNRGLGHATPFFKSPSCPVSLQEVSLPSSS
ncbi:hypothetical protein MBAV_005685 [Candidatus Magnetobacterium bavaricum]|uniref:Uncharacterized protein n=1 Tax=Candidatus Magnetobacterium bavaricum TaxID=29290 RepID=A0A0F3GJQ1_9BACT|nr:hypothetical protein MBAV_005685 [Candidatus Magnetobacterium bavaricum]